MNGCSGSHRPTRADKGHCVDESDDRESGDQTHLCYCSYQQSQTNLHCGAREIKRVLHSAHEMLRHLFHDAGIHGHAADAASRSHHSVQKDGDRKHG